MSVEILQFAFSLFVALAALLFSLEVWHRAIVICSRERIFAVRASLFDVAADADCFHDEAYKYMRQQLNGFLRWADEATGVRVFMLVLYVALFQRPTNLHIPGLSESPIKDAVERAQADLNQTLKRHILLASPSGIVLVAALHMTFRAKRALRTLMAHNARMGTDDDYARQERNWWDRGGSSTSRLICRF